MRWLLTEVSKSSFTVNRTGPPDLGTTASGTKDD